MEKVPRTTAPAGGKVRIELAPETIAWIVAVGVGLWLLHTLWLVVLLLVVALVFAGTLHPLVERLEARGLKRTTALLLLLLGLALASALFLFLTVPAVLDQLTVIVHDLPEQRARLIVLLGKRGLTAPLGQALRNVGVDQAFVHAQTYLISYTAQALAVLGYAATTFILAFYLLSDGKRMQGALYAVVPRHYHMRLARIILNLVAIVGGYMRGQLITSVALAVFTFALLLACGVSNALSLALLAALFDVLPFVGGLLAAIPIVLAAFGHGQAVGFTAACCMFVYQEFENKVLVPKVYGNALRLSPAVVVLALIAGGILLGMVGALLALPIAAGLQMILEELGVEMPGDDSDDPRARAKDRKAEAAYEAMSAGATAPEAGQIAAELAQDIRAADASVEANQKE